MTYQICGNYANFLIFVIIHSRGYRALNKTQHENEKFYKSRITLQRSLKFSVNIKYIFGMK